MFTLPSYFQKKITKTFGKKGQTWLEQFPSLLDKCIQKWNLSIEKPCEYLSYNFISTVKFQNGKKAVIKLGVPNPEMETEIESLQFFAGNNSVKLLDYDKEFGVLLLEKIKPGKQLFSLKNNEKETLIFSKMIRELPVPAPENHSFPAIKDWGMVFKRIRKTSSRKLDTDFKRKLDKAEYLLSELTKPREQKMLLHGDLHHFNILFDEKRGWLAIDPKGVIGERIFETARFLHNPYPQFLQNKSPVKITEQRLEILSSELNTDKERILDYAFIDCILSSCWNIEEADEDWKYSIKCASVLEKIR